jgi:hypothetical protein
MIRDAYLVTPHDSVNQVFLFRRVNSQGVLSVKDEYQDLVCKKCGKLDEKSALSRGFLGRVDVRSKRPFVLSTDDFYLLDQRAEQIFRDLLPNQIDFFPIPSTQFSVATPKIWIEPHRSDAAFEFLDPTCIICGRPREVVFAKKKPPTLGDARPVLAINLETRLGAGLLWLVPKEVEAELRKLRPRLTGIVISPIQVDDGKTP